jgi:hypothetical protein
MRASFGAFWANYLKSRLQLNHVQCTGTQNARKRNRWGTLKVNNARQRQLSKRFKIKSKKNQRGAAAPTATRDRAART